MDALALPAELFNRKFAFGMDFGSSTIKIVHTEEDGDALKFHFSQYARQDVKEALQFLKEISEGKLEKDQEIAMIGVGTSQFAEDIVGELGIKPEVIFEHDMDVKGFNFLAKHIPYSDFLIPPSPKAIQKGSSHAESLSMLWSAWNARQKLQLPRYMHPEAQKYSAPSGFPETIEYPVLLGYSGSSTTYLKAETDDTYLLTDWNPTGGRTFYGQGQLFTDHTKSFHELHDLACSGRAGRVDQHISSILGQVEPDDDVYGVESGIDAMDINMFTFGHTVDKPRDKCKDADLLSAVMSFTAKNVSREAHMWAAQFGIKNVFFYGSFATHSQELRDMISIEFLYRNYGHLTDFTCDHWFVKCGPHLGAIGTLLTNLQLR